MVVRWPQDISQVAQQCHKELGDVYEVLRGRQIGGYESKDINRFSELGYKKVLDHLFTIFKEALCHEPEDIPELNSERWVLSYALTPSVLSQIGWSLPDNAGTLIISVVEKCYTELLPILQQRWQKNFVAQVLFIVGDKRSFTILTNPIDADRIRIMVYLLEGSLIIGSHSVQVGYQLRQVNIDNMGFLIHGFRRSILEKHATSIISYIEKSLPSKIDISDIENMCKMLLLVEHPSALHIFLSLLTKCTRIFFNTMRGYSEEQVTEYELSWDGWPEERCEDAITLNPGIQPDLYRTLFLQRIVNGTHQDYSEALQCKHAVIRWLTLKSVVEFYPDTGATSEDTRKLLLFASIEPVVAEALNDRSERIRAEAQRALSSIKQER